LVDVKPLKTQHPSRYRQGSSAVASGFNSTVNALPDQVHDAVAVKVHDHGQVNVNVNERQRSSRVPRISGQALI
jgi:hypothetical protein